ncbi:MAG: TIGR01906 family membrane protein [Clostridia bacterium]|nr:TIGR01906 family membrane protein [Clostridia bacterium]
MNIVRTKIIAAVFGFILVFVLLLASILNVGLSQTIFKEVQLKYDIADYAGCSQETLDYATEQLIRYIRGERDDLNIKGTVFNIETAIFNEKEIAHMVDVKNLFIIGQNILYCCILVMILLFLFEITTNREAFNYKFFKSVTITMIISLALFLIIGAMAFLDFDSFWMGFHKVFFTNDLFLLDPNTDFLIRMMPLEFFISIVSRIGITFGISYTVSIAAMTISHYVLKGSKSK